MFSNGLNRAADNLRTKALGVVWVQWAGIGGLGASRRRPGALVDPEGLMLLSLYLADEEPRLWDFAAGWMVRGSRLISVQRLNNLAATFPELIRGRVGELAALVQQAGRDPRWKMLAVGRVPKLPRPGKVVDPRRRLLQPPALLLRLRSGFGVDVRTDVLGCLLGLAGERATTRRLAEDLGYHPNAVRPAVTAMADARLIERAGSHPASYWISPENWARLLGLEALPPWWPWKQLFALVVSVLAWRDSSLRKPPSPFVASTQVRALMEDHHTTFERIGIALPGAAEHPGEAYLAAAGRVLEAIAESMEQNV